MTPPPDGQQDREINRILEGFTSECILEAYERNGLNPKLTGAEPRRIRFSEACVRLQALIDAAVVEELEDFNKFAISMNLNNASKHKIFRYTMDRIAARTKKGDTL